VDTQTVQRWLAELDSDNFQTRDRARQQLARLGKDAKPLYRAALKGQISPEKRRRLEGLLTALPAGYDVSDFEVPAGMTFLTVDDLVAQYLKRDPGTFPEGGWMSWPRWRPAVTRWSPPSRPSWIDAKASGCATRRPMLWPKSASGPAPPCRF
jgi:hypothetical protein